MVDGCGDGGVLVASIIIMMLRLLLRGGQASFGTKYSRFYLEDLAVDREAIAREERAAAELRRQQAVLEYSC